jgi:hypothetical protein
VNLEVSSSKVAAAVLIGVCEGPWAGLGGAVGASGRLGRVVGRVARRSENVVMEEFLRLHGVRAKVKYIWTGSLKGTWRLSNLSEKWTPEVAEKLNGLGFTDFEGSLLGPYSGNGGMFSVFVRGHREMVA